MTFRHSLCMVLVASIALLTAAEADAQTPSTRVPWEARLIQGLPELGHRNWIAIVDSAYPVQTSPGIETIVTGEDQLKVVQSVLKVLASARHVRPVIYLDAELAHVPEADAPGIDEYRVALAKTLGDRKVQRLEHPQIISRLDVAGAKFRVLVLKTNLALPYTSVFIELDCAYWSPEAEQRLRAAMAAETKQPAEAK